MTTLQGCGGVYGNGSGEWWLTDAQLAARAIHTLGSNPAPATLAEWIEATTGRKATPEQLLAVLLLVQGMPASIEAATHIAADKNAGGNEPPRVVSVKIVDDRGCECHRRKLPKHFPPCRRAGEAITYSEPPRAEPGHKHGGHDRAPVKHHGRRSER